jgi:type I restriction enzyme S subunit
VGLATSTTDFYRPTGVPLIRNQNIRPLLLDDREMLFLDPQFASQFENKKLKARDVITTRTGANIGQTCLVPARYAGSHSFTTLIVSCDESQLLPEYLVQHLNAPVGVREVERLGTSGGKGNLNVTDFTFYRIDLPPLSEQHETAQKLSDLDSTKTKILSQSDALRSLVRELTATLTG